MRAFVVSLCGLFATAGWLVSADQMPAASPAFSYAEPGISPDGHEIAFESGGAIWSVPVSGGDAHLLVADGATDRRPLFSPDGKRLAFVSTRTGGGDIYVLTLATGEMNRLTADDGLEALDSWSRDGHWIYFSTTAHDIAGMNDIYRVAIDGGTPMAVSEDRYVNEFEGVSSPDGSRLAFVARGVASNQWWRRGSSHLDQSELWTLDLRAPTATAASYTRLSPMGARQVWPMWSGDGRDLFYVSDRGGAENVWVRPATAGGVDRALTRFTDGRVLWPTITADGRTIAFERDFGVWTLDTGSGRAQSVSIVRRGSPVAPPPDRLRQATRFEDLALSPDGKKVAFVARGDVFAASAKDGGDATRVTSTDAIESQPAWAPDSRRLVYVSARGRGQQIYLYDFATSAETPLTTGEAEDLSPRFSPDGKALAYLRDRRTVHVLDLASKQDRVIATGVFADTIDSPVPVWSPDGRWIALFGIGTKAFTNVQLVPITGGAPRPVSFLANVFTNGIAWSHDGAFLLFDTRQRTESGQLARVDLTPRAPHFREDLFRDLFSSPTPATPASPSAPTAPAAPAVTTVPAVASAVSAPTHEVVFDGIRDRLSLLPIGLDVSRAVISADGKTACIVASSAGQTNLYAYSLDDLATERPVARQLTTTTGQKADPQFTADGKEIYYLDAGRINIVSVDRREARPLAVTAEMTVDFSAERSAIFTQAWTLMRDNFYDAAFHGVDWERSRQVYGARVAAASTPDEMRRLFLLMIGDLNASHLGASAPGPAAVAGHLGLRFDRAAYEATGRLMIQEIIPLGPAALATGLAKGDVIVSVDGRPTAGANLDLLLANTIDHRVVIGVTTGSASPRDLVVRPTSQAAEKALIYRAWVEANREYVLKVSGGRLGYVHMINMSAAALDQLYLDLDAENHARDGVIVDIRNNSGGFVNAYALDVFARRPYLRMSSRGVPEAPARSVLGQRALELPTALVTNQHSLSDAEDFTEGYRALRLGPIVGEPTAGWIIYTWDVQLVDGSTFRLPHMRVRAADNTEMEGHPRPVDIDVSRPIGETLAGTDAQLDAAVRALLKALGKAE
jgi:Tol biopolymer transport system component/C-terminal processing protease CtpA/Prc